MLITAKYANWRQLPKNDLLNNNNTKIKFKKPRKQRVYIKSTVCHSDI